MAAMSDARPGRAIGTRFRVHAEKSFRVLPRPGQGEHPDRVVEADCGLTRSPEPMRAGVPSETLGMDEGGGSESSHQGRNTVRSRHPWLPLIAFTTVIVGVYILFGLATIKVYPRVWVDEAWYTQPAWSFVDQGSFTLPMFDGLAGVDRDNVVMGRVYLLLMAGAYWLSDVNVTAVRLVSFMAGLVAIAAVCAVGHEVWNRRVGVLAAVLMAVSPNFVRQSHDARPEMVLLATWMSALYLTLSGDRKGSSWRLAAGGLVAGLAADTHLNGVVFPVALFIVLLVRRSSPRKCAFYLLGLVVASAWWAWVHVLQDPGLFQEQLDMFSNGVPVVDALEEPLQMFALEVARYILVVPRASILLVWVAVLAAVVLLRHHRDRALLSLLAIIATVFLFMALFVGSRSTDYAILLWPLCALLVARLIDTLPRPGAIGLATALVVISVASIGWTIWQHLPSDYDRYVAKLRAHVPLESTVQADPFIWFGMADQPLIATHYFVLTKDSYQDAVRRLGVDYVILDQPNLGGRARYSAQVSAFLEEHAELVAEVEDPLYGGFIAGDRRGYLSPIYRIID